ncbi:tRNA pseudouridine(13) synthase TruD [Shewanella sp. WXL01]|uniref:tRNA pseudouridine synthase D n=1 Tax=Shewanella maritima TaxID=2520507 RepID=A0A411PEY8_9GAMM|nr:MULTISPECIES: tRNA pseudouridine(13) synthase TruD [Shewanella]NKF49765.1 tRNA pseudouridine(13) synthase TruD [Shewanella sp. WXL01]QBF82157.1 tRNA pseudouridine(13) synthase TruD [Shewanella maritima]
MTQLHYLHGKPQVTADLRTENADFIVQEILPFSPTGEGEHHLVQIRKSGFNTNQVVDMLAKFAKVHPKEVTYAGQKDKNAVTEQWFGIRIPGKDTPDWQAFSQQNITVLQSSRHSKKLRIGALLGNKFTLTLRNVSDTAAFEARLEQVLKTGVPNYFGEQRFGHNGKNLTLGRNMLNGGRKIKDRKKRSMFLSAVRSNIFNLVVSHRLQTSGLQGLDGDCVMLSGSKSYFVADSWDDTIEQRLITKDIQLSAPLWGRGAALAQGDAAQIEQAALTGFEQDLKGLEQAGLEQERRPLMLEPQGLKWQLADNTMVLEFILPAGSYATSVLRELVDYQDVQQIAWQKMVAEQSEQQASAQAETGQGEARD